MLRLAQEQRGNTGNYMRLSGTSMAAGVTSGVVALVLHANRGLTPNAVKAVLEYSSIPVLDDDGSRFDPLAQGAGQIEVAGSVALARAINPQAPVGIAVAVDDADAVDDDRQPRRMPGRSRSSRATAASPAQKLLSEQRPAWAPQHRLGRGPRQRRRQHRLGQ